MKNNAKTVGSAGTVLAVYCLFCCFAAAAAVLDSDAIKHKTITYEVF